MSDLEKPRSSKPTDDFRNTYFAVFEIILIFSGILILGFVTRHSIFSDGQVRFDALSVLLSERKIPETPYSLIGPIFSAPLWFLGKWIKSPEWWCSLYNFLIFTAGLFFVYRICRVNTNSGLLRRFLLILIFASMFPYHQTAYFGEVFTAVLVGVGILAISHGNSSWGWGSIILGVANTPASVIGLWFVVLARMLKTRRMRYILILATAMGLILAEAWIKQGSPFSSGYEGNAGFKTVLPYSGLPGFSYPLFFGIISILFSFGKGLAWFCPGLLLPVRKSMPGITRNLLESYRLWIYFLIGMILVYAKWWSWYGGWFWGPRFFLFASIPASFAIAAYISSPSRSITSSFFTLLALALSFWIGVNGVVFGQHSLEICTANNYALESLCWYVPEFSVIFRPFVVSKQLSTADLTISAFSFAVFAYLSAPLFYQLLNGLILQGKELKNRHLNFDKWEF